MALVTFVSGDDGDWIGMYYDGRLVEEGHSIPGYRVAERLINAHVESVEQFEVDQEWLEAEMNLPPNLGDIPQEVRK